MKARLRQLTTAFAAMAAVLGSASCGQMVRQGKAPAFLIIDLLQAASGAAASAFGGTLASDVVTLIDRTVGGVTVRVPTLFADPGRVTLRLQLKDAGVPGNSTAPSAINAITVNRYHVSYRRSDGRNVQGVDVPYAFDGAITVTVATSPVAADFVLVRVQAKEEAPLAALANGGGRIDISTIADVTFYGHDLAGNDVQVTGSISINFADWGDPG
jgi:hypothetical protein